MSQQGPGGYGGGYGPPGGPGGYGPPGAPPGGYPPGAPPGGYPPAPHGYGQPAPPGYGAPGAPPGAPQPPKKTNPLLYVAIGCGALIVLGGIGSLVAVALMARAAKNRVDAAAGAFSAALENAADAGLLAPDAGTGTGQGGPACAQAADCCKIVVAATGAANPEAINSCESIRTNPGGVACAQALQTYRVSARLLGKACP